MLNAKEQSLLDALESACLNQGVEIVTVEIVGGKKSPTIRVYIDKEGGIGFEDLSTAQKWIDETVEELDPFPGAYMLEVSSPGIDRPLRTIDHFKRQIGEEASIRLAQKQNGRASFTGTIKSVDGANVILLCDGEEVLIPLSSMKRANIKGRIEF